MQKTSTEAILDVVSEELKQLLLNETLAIKRYGFDSTPLQEARLDAGGNSADGIPKFLLDYDKGQDVATIIQNFATHATNSVLAIHQNIEKLPQNRPFGASTDVERLILENINLMKAIMEADDAALSL